ncbi:MAG: hypothetical protein CBC01_08770 [Betaproteobacteria bacterium TMED41]|nr:MAG: hypothetical protein CBC01_08770 [Betaproteobacteria bacterium TMED41]
MLSQKSLVQPQLLSFEDIKHFESVCRNLVLDCTDVLISSQDQVTNDYIFHFLEKRLKDENEIKLTLYQHNKIDSFLADSLLGPFETAFSKLNEIKNLQEKPIKRVLLISDFSKLDSREIDLLISLKKHKHKHSNPIMILADFTKTKFDPQKVQELFNDSIRWDPDPITQSKLNSDKTNNETLNKNGKKNNSGKASKSNFPRAQRFLLGIVLLVFLFFILLVFTGQFKIIKTPTNQILNYLNTTEIPYLKKLIDSPPQNNFLTKVKKNKIEDIEILDLSGLSQFQIASGFLIQYSAHLKKVDALQWLTKHNELKNLKIIKLEKSSDATFFYALVSKPFKNQQEAIQFASNVTFSGKWWIRSLKSVKDSQAKTVNNIKNF